MVIQTWDSGAVCRAGETAYTVGCVHSKPVSCIVGAHESSDYQLALKYFLRAVEMQVEPSDPTGGKKRSREWWGIKLVRLSFHRAVSSVLTL